MKDERLYAKFTLDFADSPKIKPLPVEAKWALVEMILYSRRMKTDGFLSKPLATCYWGASVCLALASNDAEKPSLREVENGYQIHDFEEHQTTSAELDALSLKRKCAGQKGGKASAQAKAKQVLKQKSSKSNPETETETEEVTTNVVTSMPRKRGTRLPDAWNPSAAVIAAMRAEHPSVNLKAEHAKFVDYWQSKAGREATKLDWDATWRNWIRTAAERAPSRNGQPRQSTSDRIFAEVQALKTQTGNRLELI